MYAEIKNPSGGANPVGVSAAALKAWLATASQLVM
jgi:hypothetical protein